MQPQNKKRWVIAEQIPPHINDLLFDHDPIMRQFLHNRRITDRDLAVTFLNRAGSLHDPFLMKDMDLVADRLVYAVRHNEPIAVYGDYDVDGVTATALLAQVLQAAGANVRGYIPNRFEEGYGLNNEALDTLKSDGICLTITVDCGIRSPDEAEHARQLGMDLIISDHHEPLETIPDALAVICPKRTGDLYPEKNLAGVGLAYKICEAFVKRMPEIHVDPADWLDLVAIGTVADIVPLVGENRSLVRAGLEKLRACRHQGVVSLAAVSGIQLPIINARDIGFSLGPRLNAAGRLESALASFNLLMCADLMKAGELAQQLDDQNHKRQEMTLRIQEKAEQLATANGSEYILSAFDEDFNMGIVGLAASRLTDLYYRPAVVGYKGEEFTRASCRSIPEFHINQALDACSDLLVRHGGHAMAAGFTVRNENLPELVERLEKIAACELEGKDIRPVLYADLDIPLVRLKPQILQSIDLLEPTGLGNPGVLLVSRGVEPTRFKKVGKDNNHLRLTVKDGIAYDAIAFRQGRWADAMPSRIDILYAFEKNIYQGRETFQLNIRDLKPTGIPD